MNDDPKIELSCQLVNGVIKSSTPFRLHGKQTYLAIAGARASYPIYAMTNVAKLHAAALFNIRNN
ncbi:MAG: hypothetical protein GY928_19955 [Colwellia sp.]|nr:hypothetical protein [Colwellia sp.]